MSIRPTCATTSRSMEGYHSPQVAVDVRLNTNESPEPPPAGVHDAQLAEALASRRVAPLSRPCGHRAAGRRSPRTTACAAEQVFAANGSNEVLQSLLLAYGGPGRPRARCSSRPTRCTATSPASAAPRWSRASAAATSTLDLDDVRERDRTRTDPTSRSCARRTTPPAWSTARDRADRARPGRRVRRARDRRRGLRAVRAVVGGRARRRRRAARGVAHVLEDVVDGGGPPRLSASARVGRRRARQGGAAVSPRRGQADRRLARARLRREMDAACRRPRRRARPARGRAGRPAGRRVAVGRATSSCSARDTTRRRRGVAGTRRPLGARAQLRVVASPRRLPAGHHRHAATKTIASSPRLAEILDDGHDTRGCDEPQRRAGTATKRPTIDIAARARRHRAASTSPPDLPFFDHMLGQLGKHGGFDLASTATGDLEIDAHHTVEDVGILLGEVFREALGDKAGVRRFASIRVPLDEALVDVALDLSGRPVPVYEVDVPRREDPRRPAVRPAAGRGVLARVRHGRRDHAARHRRVRGQEHAPHHRGHVQGRGPRAARRGARRGRRGVPSTKGML